MTLDGDVDFNPKSVWLLLDRMIKNSNVGAVCGRIHPIGSGTCVLRFINCHTRSCIVKSHFSI